MGWRTLCAATAALGSSLSHAKLTGPAWMRKRLRRLHGGDGHAPASYEYTVRMGDGSSHVFREEMPMSWRQGERLMFIEGSDPLN